MPHTDNQMSSQESPTESRQGEAKLPESNEADLLANKIAELESAVATYKDQLLRKAAEFENYKKRIENEYSSVVKFSTEDLIQKFLPVMDDFERMIKANRRIESKESSNEDVFMKGIELIYSKFRTIMEAQGVKEFEVVGKPFNPELHDALMQMPKADVPPHTVIEEVEKGYTMHEKVIRHARVIVSAEVSS
jgi:molecular chaperone GrpE